MGSISQGTPYPDANDYGDPNIAVRIPLAIFTCLERIEEIAEITDVVYP